MTRWRESRSERRASAALPPSKRTRTTLQTTVNTLFLFVCYNVSLQVLLFGVFERYAPACVTFGSLIRKRVGFLWKLAQEVLQRMDNCLGRWMDDLIHRQGSTTLSSGRCNG